MNNNLCSILKGGLIGLAVGDALGVPVEFMSREELSKNKVKDMFGYGTHNQPKGTWSDDSSLTFCLVESLSKGYNLEDLSNNFIKWYRHGYLTAHGNVFDIGNGTRDAIITLESGVEPTTAGSDNSFNNGNGSLMRILPIAFYLLNEEDLNIKFKVVHDVSSLTHRHIISKVGCSIYVEMAINLLKGYEKFEAYSKTKETILNYYSDSKYENVIKTYCRVLNSNINELKENEIKSSGYVVHTLEASLWCFLNNENYKDIVLTAINLGDDTDTTGAVVGGLAGIYYGLDNIPCKWVNSLAKIEEIKVLSTTLNFI